MDFSFSQSHRDGFIVAQGFNPGLITIEKTFKSHRDDVIKRKICHTFRIKCSIIHFFCPIYKDYSEF